MKKTYDEILQQLKLLVEEQTLGNITTEIISDESRMREELTLDSLDYASIFLGGEKWLNIKVREEGINWAQVQTIGQLAKLFENAQ